MAHRRWIWVEDTTTGHRYDVDHRRVDQLVQRNAVRIVEGYPANEGPDARPRPAKHATGLGGEPRRDVPAPEPTAPPTGETASTPTPTPPPTRRNSTRTATAPTTAAPTSSEGAE